jgi:hypothetical protein
MTSVSRITSPISSLLLAIGTSLALAACSTTPSPQPPPLNTIDESHLSPLSLSLLRSVNAPTDHGKLLELETDTSLANKLSPEERALVLSEAFYPSQENVDLTTKQSRAIRSAHYAYEGILSQRCRETRGQLCIALATQYSKAVRLLAENLLRDNWNTMPLTTDKYDVTLNGDGGSIAIQEWSIQIPGEELPARANDQERQAVVGAPAVACKTSPARDQIPTFTTCTPIEILVTFEASTDAAHARASVTAVDTLANERVRVGDAELALYSSPTGAWASLSSAVQAPPGSDTSARAHLGCLGEVDFNRVTTLFVLDSDRSAAPWIEITSSLSADPEISEHFNFCLYTDFTQGTSTQTVNDLASSLTLNLSPPSTLLSATIAPRVVFITQGGHSNELVTALRTSSRQSGRVNGASPVETSGVFAISPHLFTHTKAPGASIDSQTEASAVLLAQRDIKRLLSKLVEQRTQEELETEIPEEIDLSVSPIM